MGASIGFLIFLQIFLIALNAIFACAEIAVLSINETKLERMAESGNKKAKRLFRLTSEPARFLATIQVAITLSGFLGSAFAADNFSEPLVDWLISLGVTIPAATLDSLAVVLITLILSYFTLVFGELVPKRLAMKKSESIAMAISGLVSGISLIFKPVVWFLSVSTNAILRLCGVDPNEAEDNVSEEEIRMLVDAGSEKGTIDLHEKEFIQNIFEFNDIVAGDVATHRTDVDMLWLEDGDAVWESSIHESRHTLYPVCDGSPDNIIGILNAKDYFRLKDKSRASIMEKAVHPAYFVSENIKADVLFRNMNKSRNSLAVVIDEYGGMVGIVTIFDLIEELVGELSDEINDVHGDEAYIEQLSENSWRVIGNIPLKELEEVTALELEGEDFDTFTGLVFDALGMVPGDGNEAIELELPRLSIHISCVKAHQIEEAIVSLKPEATEHEKP